MAEDDGRVFIEAVCAAQSLEEYERILLSGIERRVGFDVAFCSRVAGPGPYAPGLDTAVLRRVRPSWQDYGQELLPIHQATLHGRRVAVDREFFGARFLHRTRVYREVMAPHRGHSSLQLSLGPDGEALAKVVLGRTRRGFSGAELDYMQRLQRILTVCELATQRLPLVAPCLRLTPREQDLVEYLRLGLTNRDIATACGTSRNTVRNQLVHLFQKLDVCTRSEAVSRSYELSLLRPAFEGARSAE